MNITLSADKDLIEKCRQYAREHNTSLNNLVRDYLKKICGEQDSATNADEFSSLARTMPGRSPKGYRFQRDEIYDRVAES
jgi:hypothetical protein